MFVIGGGGRVALGETGWTSARVGARRIDNEAGVEEHPFTLPIHVFCRADGDVVADDLRTITACYSRPTLDVAAGSIRQCVSEVPAVGDGECIEIRTQLFKGGRAASRQSRGHKDEQ